MNTAESVLNDAPLEIPAHERRAGWWGLRAPVLVKCAECGETHLDAVKLIAYFPGLDHGHSSYTHPDWPALGWLAWMACPVSGEQYQKAVSEQAVAGWLAEAGGWEE